MKERGLLALSRYRKETGRLFAEGKRRVSTVRDSVRTAGNRLSRNEKLAIVLAVGIVIGYGVKIMFRDTVTMGYQDYAVERGGKVYDLLEMERELDRKQAEEAAAAMSGEMTEEAVPAEGGSCQ